MRRHSAASASEAGHASASFVAQPHGLVHRGRIFRITLRLPNEVLACSKLGCVRVMGKTDNVDTVWNMDLEAAIETVSGARAHRKRSSSKGSGGGRRRSTSLNHGTNRHTSRFDESEQDDEEQYDYRNSSAASSSSSSSTSQSIDQDAHIFSVGCVHPKGGELAVFIDDSIDWDTITAKTLPCDIESHPPALHVHIRRLAMRVSADKHCLEIRAMFPSGRTRPNLTRDTHFNVDLTYRKRSGSILKHYGSVPVFLPLRQKNSRSATPPRAKAIASASSSATSAPRNTASSSLAASMSVPNRSSARVVRGVSSASSLRIANNGETLSRVEQRRYDEAMRARRLSGGFDGSNSRLLSDMQQRRFRSSSALASHNLSRSDGAHALDDDEDDDDDGDDGNMSSSSAAIDDNDDDDDDNDEDDDEDDDADDDDADDDDDDIHPVLPPRRRRSSRPRARSVASAPTWFSPSPVHVAAATQHHWQQQQRREQQQQQQHHHHHHHHHQQQQQQQQQQHQQQRPQNMPVISVRNNQGGLASRPRSASVEAHTNLRSTSFDASYMSSTFAPRHQNQQQSQLSSFGQGHVTSSWSAPPSSPWATYPSSSSSSSPASSSHAANESKHFSSHSSQRPSWLSPQPTQRLPGRMSDDEDELFDPVAEAYSHDSDSSTPTSPLHFGGSSWGDLSDNLNLGF